MNRDEVNKLTGKAAMARTETGKLVGPFNVQRSRSGYHPDVNKGPLHLRTADQKEQFHVSGYTLPTETASAGILVGNFRWESVLVNYQGTCSRFDVLHQERKTVYTTGIPSPNNIWNKVWIVDCDGFDGHAEKKLVIGTNGKFQCAGFTCWDFYTTKVNAKVIHETTTTNSQCSSIENYHWHALCGPLLLHNTSSAQETKLYDIRDGECRHIFSYKYPLQPMKYSTPMTWIYDSNIALAHDTKISVWDINSQRSIPMITFPTVLGTIRAMDMENSRLHTISNHRRRPSVPFDGVYCTDHAVYILDKRAKSATAFRLPLNVDRVHSIFCTDESIVIGCTMQHYLGVPPTREKVLHLSVRSMAIITSYTIPPCTKAGLNTSVTQVWADSKYILGLSETGLYVFEQYPSEQQHRIPIDDCAVIRLRSIIGPNEQQNPSFHAHNGRVLLTSANQSPIWCEI